MKRKHMGALLALVLCFSLFCVSTAAFASSPASPSEAVSAAEKDGFFLSLTEEQAGQDEAFLLPVPEDSVDPGFSIGPMTAVPLAEEGGTVVYLDDVPDEQ